MADKSYWEDRQERKFISGEKKVRDYYKGLDVKLRQAQTEVEKVIHDFYMRYSAENDINSLAMTKRALNKVEIGDLQAFIDKAYDNMGKYNLELNNMSIRARITRYQALEKQIDAILQQHYAIEYELKGAEALGGVYNESYYRTWFNIDQYKGFHAEFAQVNPRTVSELLAYPFNGADFSSRLWKQKDYMMQQLNEALTTAFIQGKNPNTLVKEFRKKFDARAFEAKRLLHTEASFLMEQASQAAYAEDEVEKYEWLATLDSKTCEECQPLDGKVFDVGKGIVGVNLTPKHPLCRCTTIPYYEPDDDEVEERISRNAKGERELVPATMAYPEWKAKYLGKGDE